MKLWIGSLILILLNSLVRWELTFRTKVRAHWMRREASRSPGDFRRLVRIDADRDVPFGRQIQAWQQADFAALDAAWVRLANGRGLREEGRGTAEGGATDEGQETNQEVTGDIDSAPRLSLDPRPSSLDAPTRAWIERPRGHSKTSDIALQIAWILLFARRPLQGIAAAADRDQADLIAEALQRIARLNPVLFEPLVFQKHVVSNPQTGARLEILSSDVQSSWGLLPDFVICDELCHWDQPDMWFSLFSSAAKRPHCLLVVLTNAGVGREWHWEAREAARQSPRWHFSSLDGPQAPWITPDLLDEQRLLLPEPVFERLWLNRWQHSDGDFVSLAEAEGCRDESLEPQESGQPGTHYFAAIDYAEKHDHTVAVLVHPGGSRDEGEGSRDGARRGSVARPSSFAAQPFVVVDRLDVFVPSPDRPTPVAWVERWIRDVAARFHRVTFVLDEYQLVGTIQSLQQEFDVRRFPFRAGKGNHALALNLRNLILGRRLRWYPGCGQLPSSAGGDTPRDDLETELASLLYRQSPSGLCRIDHRSGRHDDRAFALGAATLYAVERSIDTNDLEITPPTPGGDFDFA